MVDDSGHKYWTHHAWNVDTDGQAIDRTWHPPAVRYVGTVIDRAALDAAWLDAGHIFAPVLDAGGLADVAAMLPAGGHRGGLAPQK